MAALNEATRAGIARALNRFLPAISGATFTKAQLRAAIDACDDWADANAAEFNSALPAAYRTAATTAQKTILLCAVIIKRAGLGLGSLIGSED